MTAMEIADK